MKDATIKRVRIVVYGHVQGVFFRAHIRQVAKELDVTGTVRNQVDGTVEIIAEGKIEDLNILIEAAKVGPKTAIVDDTTLEWSDAEGTFNGFKAIF